MLALLLASLVQMGNIAHHMERAREWVKNYMHVCIHKEYRAGYVLYCTLDILCIYLQ